MVQKVSSQAKAFVEWESRERATRLGTAMTRCRHLEELALSMLLADVIDAAIAIWADFIDGQGVEWADPDEVSLLEQANVLARLAPYLPGKELLSLARSAWGPRTTEAFVVEPTGDHAIIGKVAWYPLAGSLVVSWFPTADTFGVHTVLRESSVDVMMSARIGPRPTSVQAFTPSLLRMHAQAA